MPVQGGYVYLCAVIDWFSAWTDPPAELGVPPVPPALPTPTTPSPTAGSDGAIWAVGSVGRDISDRLRADTALRETAIRRLMPQRDKAAEGVVKLFKEGGLLQLDVLFYAHS